MVWEDEHHAVDDKAHEVHGNGHQTIDPEGRPHGDAERQPAQGFPVHLLIYEGQMADARQHFPEEDHRRDLRRGEEQRQQDDHDHGEAEAGRAAHDASEENRREDVGEKQRRKIGHGLPPWWRACLAVTGCADSVLSLESVRPPRPRPRAHQMELPISCGSEAPARTVSGYGLREGVVIRS